MEKRNVYVGHRYVPKVMGEWDKEISYEGLSIVTYQGASYTSKKHVPIGIDINNKEYWSLTGNYNAQVEGYRKEVADVKEDIKNTRKYVDDSIQSNTKFVEDNVEEMNRRLINKAEKSDLNYTINKVNRLEETKAEKHSLNTKASYRYVDDEIKQLNDRFDKVITTPANSVSEQEIIDARMDEDTLGENISKIKDKTLPFFKEMTRDAYFNYTPAENIRVVNGTREITDKGLEITGDGTFLNPSYRRYVLQREEFNNILDTYYTNTTVMFVDHVPVRLVLGFRDHNTLAASTSFYNLKPNRWLNFSYVYKPTGNHQWQGDFNNAVEAWYKDGNDAKNKKFIIKKINTINLTEIFGSGNEPSKEVMDKVFMFLESDSDDPSPSDIIKAYIRYEERHLKKEKPFVFGELQEYYPSPSFEDMSINSSNPLKEWTTQDIYDLYDQLWVDHPKRVERKFLGYASNAVGNDDVSRSIYEYIFKPPYTEKDHDRGEPFSPPLKVLLTTGVHGNEKSTVYTTYKMFENMMKNEINPLTPLRMNVEFRIIPVLNPYGFDNYTRLNASGDDLNRDFLESEVNEIKTVRNWIYTHDDAVLLMDIHNTWMDSFGLTYVVAYQDHMKEIYQGVMRTLSFDWSMKYGHDDNTTEGYVMHGGSGHLYYEGSRHSNIPHAVLLETSANDHDRVEYSSEVLERTYGLTTNYLRSFFNWLNNN